MVIAFKAEKQTQSDEQSPERDNLFIASLVFCIVEQLQEDASKWLGLLASARNLYMHGKAYS